MKAVKTLKLVGSGHFPTDMLRYDACWPRGQEDVHKMVSTQREHRTIEVSTHGQFTINRWKSFGWRPTT